MEINSIALYERNNISTYYSWPTKRRAYRFNEDWINGVFTSYQREFLESKKYAMRPRPNHSPTIEVFVDESLMSEKDWTIARMIFDGSVCRVL